VQSKRIVTAYILVWIFNLCKTAFARKDASWILYFRRQT